MAVLRSQAAAVRVDFDPLPFPPSLTPSITLFFQYSQALHEGGVAGAVEGLARKGGAFPLSGVSVNGSCKGLTLAKGGQGQVPTTKSSRPRKEEKGQ